MGIAQPVSPAQWNTGDLVFATYDGRILNRYWESLINYNSESSRQPLDTKYAIGLISNLFSTLFTARSLLSHSKEIGAIGNGYFKLYKIAMATTVALISMNLITVIGKNTHKNLSDVKSTKDKFYVVLWKATPYLLIITNIALIIIDPRNNKVIRLIKLAVTGITLIDLTPWKPKAFGWYLDVGIRLPLDTAALYYDPNSMSGILIGWATDPRIVSLFQGTFAKLGF